MGLLANNPVPRLGGFGGGIGGGIGGGFGGYQQQQDEISIV